MKKFLKLLLVLLVVFSTVTSLLGMGFWYELRESTNKLAKRGLSYWLAIRTRVEQLESSAEVFLGMDDVPDTTAETSPAVTEPPESDTKIDTEVKTNTPEAEEDTTATANTEATDSGTEAVPEPTTGYTIKAYEGIIGVFDNDGALTETINVAVMTLPEADREALSVGIFAQTWEDVRDILDRLL